MLFTRGIQLFVMLCAAPAALAQSIDQPDVPTGLLERKGDQIVDAPAADFAVAKTYHSFQDKGRVIKGQRITILTAKLEYRVGESIRVLHVLESVKPGIEVYVMGPKSITDEVVDGHLAVPKGSLLAKYRGAVVKRPIADFNYDITTYVFTNPGKHTIQWKGYGGWDNKDLPLESNTITLKVSN
jgi:hypothetical protein